MSVIPALWDFTVTGEQVCFIEAASEAVAKAPQQWEWARVSAPTYLSLDVIPVY